MQYRRLGKTGEKVSILGFGSMRLPTIGGSVDEKKAIEMIHYALERGVNLVDSAYPYHNGESESLVGRALSGEYKNKAMLSTKLPSWLCNTRGDMDRYLREQMKKLQTDKIDIYMVHSLNALRWNKVKSLGYDKFLDEAKRDGRIRYTGFSFHHNFDVFKEIVDAYDWDVCLVQHNYMDENYQAGRKGIEYAHRKGLGIMIMEPLRGGALSNKLQGMDNLLQGRTPAWWALRWLWDREEISTVLSGMTEPEHVVENVRIADEGIANSLTDDDGKAISELRKYYRRKIQIDCSYCGYCMPCPSSVNIPECFAQYNSAHMFDEKQARFVYSIVAGGTGGYASQCKNCGKCNGKCPQSIDIPRKLSVVAGYFKK